MEVLINVDYHDMTGKYWQESCIKNKVVDIDENNLHDEIANILRDEDGITLAYKNKPQNDVFRDLNSGPKQIGYVYRGSSEIYDDVKCKWVKARFDCWVELRKVDYLELTPVT